MSTRLIIILAIFGGTVRAQIDTRISPTPPPQSVVDQPTSVSKWSGRPLTGFLSQALGSTLKEDVDATCAISESETNQIPTVSATHSSFDNVSHLTGTLNVHQDWSRASLLMQYAGGSDFYVKNSYLDNQFHRFSASEALKWSRWNLLFGQDFNYLPQSQFGFDAARGIGVGIAPTTGDSLVLPGPDLFLPPNVIQRTASANVNAEYVLGARSAITFRGIFSDLHFSGTTPGIALVDSETFSTEAQYSYALDARNSVGAAYTFMQGRTLGLSSLIQSHSVTATYGRRIGPRFKINVAMGPQFTTFTTGGVETTLGTSVAVMASTSYEAGPLSAGLSYFRGVNAGSGLFLGSESNDFEAFLNRRFGRSVHASLSAGYAQNDNLAIPSVNAAKQLNSTYAATTIERDFSRRFSAFVTYSVQTQQSSSSLCNSNGCTPFPVIHTAMIGMRVHIHPSLMVP